MEDDLVVANSKLAHKEIHKISREDPSNRKNQ